MRQDEHMSTARMLPGFEIDEETESGTFGPPKKPRSIWNPMRLLDQILYFDDRLATYHQGAQAVSMSTGIGAALGLAIGCPLWLGCVLGFVPAYLIGSIYYMSRG